MVLLVYNNAIGAILCDSCTYLCYYVRLLSSISILWMYYLCLPPSVTGEVYCFTRRQLIFRFDRRVIIHLKGL